MLALPGEKKIILIKVITTNCALIFPFQEFVNDLEAKQCLCAAVVGRFVQSGDAKIHVRA